LILVVDDNDGVRNAAITQPLRRAGYEVMDFADPLEALRWFQQTPRPPAAVVSDVIMPGLNGKQMTDQMRELQPDLAVLFVTGYAADVVWKRGLSETADMLLEKPFTSGALLDSLHQLLLRRASASAPAAPQP
jgi:CheY-like chemotaxis protein